MQPSVLDAKKFLPDNFIFPSVKDMLERVEIFEIRHKFQEIVIIFMRLFAQLLEGAFSRISLVI